MRRKFPAIAALALGGLLLSNLMMKRRHASAPTVPVEEPSGTHLPVGTATATVAALLAGGWLVSAQLKRMRGPGAMASVEESIELNVPVSVAYKQWTQFEEFPRFMDSVQEVKQLDETHTHWRARVAGKPKEWDAEITEQVPDERIAWRSTSGVKNSGVVTFHKLSDSRTKLMLHMDYQPETTEERIGGALGGVKLMTKSNLKRFKDLIEARGVEAGAWRGSVAQH
ncbi:SRPBCC family protein [Caenimonas soli]|uniref:SRPBCC family protein n=1 Tax=Caenimonas soli TaxID=2735555 RepID=UPI001F1DA267|nr:SRPBCC family protein [Caenimonas soli]